jgi:hypothetical protein
VIYVESLPRGVTIYAQYYSNLFRNDLHQAIVKKTLQIDDELKHGALNCLGSLDNTFHIARVSNFPGR